MSPRATARLAGLLYLVVAVSGGFAQMVARASVRGADVPADHRPLTASGQPVPSPEVAR